MHQEQQFELIAGWLCLDFVNTADGDYLGEWNDELKTYDDLLAWSLQTRILNEAAADRLYAKAAENPAQAEAALQKARDLRFTIYKIMSATAADDAPEECDLEAFNLALREALAYVRFVTVEGHFHRAWMETDHLDLPLWHVLGSVEDLLRSEQVHRLRECSGKECSWLFLDTSRNHSRRWCSMESCGNRTKARKHYHRIKGELQG
jgi:predicted RNA-binding Zn ribbon-like protein